MSSEIPSPRRRSWKLYLYLAGGALLAALVWHFGWRELLAALTSARPLPLLLMIAFLLAGFWVRAWKWRYALGSGASAVSLFFLAKTAGNFSPGRVGELSPLLLREHRSTRVAAWIVLDRVVEVAGTLLLGLAGAWALNLLNSAVLVGVSLLGAGGGAAGLYLLYRVDVVQRLALKAREGSLAKRLLGILAQLHMETRLLGGRLPVIVLITAVGKVLDIYAVVLLCGAFGYSASFLLVCAARCAHALVSGIPVTPDATGVPFVAAAYLLHEHAGIPYATLTAALTLEVTLINVLLWLSFMATAHRLRKPA